MQIFSLIISFLVLLTLAEGHPIDLTDTTVEIFEGTIKAKISVPLERVQKSFGGGAEIGMTTSQKRSQILSYINERVIFFEGENALPPSTMTLHFLKSGGEAPPYMEVRSITEYAEHSSLKLRNTLFFETSPLQKNLITIYSKNGLDRQISTVSEYEFTLRPEPELTTSAPSTSSATLTTSENKKSSVGEGSSQILWIPFINMGIHHILIGWDHIAFLLGILMMVNGLKNLFWVVTSFTVAHSLTLFLASAGVLTLPSIFTESMIALTIVWVGIENLFLKNPHGKWRMTFLLGLIHGVGFANTLETSGFQGWNLLVTILSFNLGVELGQLLIVGLTFPAITLISRRKEIHEMIVKYGSLLLVVTGIYWFLQRIGVGI